MSCVLLVTAATLCAQMTSAQQLPRPVETVDVERVVVDARVIDRKGEPLFGLGAADFRVKIDGNPATVESVQWVGETAQGTEVRLKADTTYVANEVRAEGRLIVFLFQKDLDRSRLAGLMRTLIDARNFIDGLSPNDRVAVLSFDSRLNVWLDFTNDREQLRRTLQHGILFEQPAALAASAAPSLLARLSAADARRTYTMEKSLLLIGEALRELPGSKSLVLVGHGFGRLGWTGVTMQNHYEDARDALIAARTSVFSLDVTNADYHSLEAGLQLVSGHTGGFFARMHLFPGQMMRRLAGALAGYYVLFVAADVAAGSHDIDVSIVDRDASVLARDRFVK